MQQVLALLNTAQQNQLILYLSLLLTLFLFLNRYVSLGLRETAKNRKKRC